MYQPSEAFVEQMDTRPFQVLLTGTRGTVALDTLEYDAAWCPSVFSLGNANAANFTGTVTCQEMPLLAGDQVTLWAQLTLSDGSQERLPLGSFLLTKVERAADTDQWTMTGEDALSVILAEEYFCQDPLNPPATAAEVLAEICAEAGLTLAADALVAAAAMPMEYDGAGGSGATMRELVGQIALLSGANALLNRAGELRLCRLTDTEFQLDAQRYYESGLTLEAEDFVLGALEVTVPGTEEGETGTQESEVVYTAQLEGETRGISFSSQWFDQTLFDGVWQAWQRKSWRPAQVTFLGDLRLDPGDVISVTDRSGETYRLAVMALAHSFDGGFRTTVSCYDPSETGSVQPQTVSQAITGLKTDLGRFRRVYTDNLSATYAELKHITTEDIVGECGTINLAKGTFNFADALVWDGTQLTVRGVLESGDGTIGGWGIRTDCFETSYEEDDGHASWSGYTRLVPASWQGGAHDAGLMIGAAGTGSGLEESSGWVMFHRDADQQWVYQNLKMGATVLGGSAISAERYLTTSEIVMGRFGDNAYSLDDFGVKISADNGVGQSSWLELSSSKGICVSGDITVGDHVSPVGTVITNYTDADSTGNTTYTAQSGTAINVAAMSIPAGTWVVTGFVGFSQNTSGIRRVSITTDSGTATGTIGQNVVQSAPISTTLRQDIDLTVILELTETTPYYLVAYQNSGSSLAVRGKLQAVRIL